MKSLKKNFQKANILIIGSGIIGKFNALELSELGFQVTIIDPTQLKNSSNAALGILMGNMYQKRQGRSWDLRKKSIELWPKWLGFLQRFNNECIYYCKNFSQGAFCRSYGWVKRLYC